MDKVQKIPWKRLMTEGAVIVVSILLAFAIDAWWQERQDRDSQRARLARVSAEIVVNRDFIQQKIPILEGAIDATSEYISWMGPEPQQISVDQYAKQWASMVDIGMFALVHRAADEYLGASDVINAQQADIRDLLLAWYSEGDRIERQYDVLREEHKELNDYSNTTTPALVTMKTMPAMQDHPSSKFPFDPAIALSDPVSESLLASYLIRLEFITRRMKRFQEWQAGLLVTIDATIRDAD
jgi:hypothetical protein